MKDRKFIDLCTKCLIGISGCPKKLCTYAKSFRKKKKIEMKTTWYGLNHPFSTNEEIV